MSVKPEARKCEECGSSKGSIFSFVLSHGESGMGKAGYWHPNCFRVATKNMTSQIKHNKRKT